MIRNGIENAAVVDRASEVFSQIIKSEKTDTLGGGDHFAQAGANDRIWNALEKHCLIDPHNFTEYYASDAIAMGAEAWLGRGYQVTAQVNCVKPSGKAQKPHRDYHLGFMSPTQTLDYPTHVHAMSPFLTLQGAVAHCDMPLESGPTKLLPFSQKFLEGYLVFEQEHIGTTLKRTTYNSLWKKVMCCFLILPSCMQLAIMCPLIFTEWQIYCKSHQHLGVQWKLSIAQRCRKHYSSPEGLLKRKNIIRPSAK